MSSTASGASEYYYACRNGQKDKVRELLLSMILDEIQANSSTALHAASYHGHTETIKLLLHKRISCSTKNKYTSMHHVMKQKKEI